MRIMMKTREKHARLMDFALWFDLVWWQLEIVSCNWNVASAWCDRVFGGSFTTASKIGCLEEGKAVTSSLHQ